MAQSTDGTPTSLTDAKFNTGIIIPAGYSYTIKADPDDTWKTQANAECNADGPSPPDYGNTAWSHGAAVGSFGVAADIFRVGTYHVGGPVGQDSDLMLGLWDDDGSDNEGEINFLVCMHEVASLLTLRLCLACPAPHSGLTRSL